MNVFPFDLPDGPETEDDIPAWLTEVESSARWGRRSDRGVRMWSSSHVNGVRSLSWQELGWFWNVAFVLGAVGVGYAVGRWA